MKLKNWEKVTGGRSGLIMICALAVLSLVIVLEHILNLDQRILGATGTNTEWGELIIDFVVICAIGSISLVLIRKSELKTSKAEHTLSYSEERYKKLFENSPLGIYRTTPDGQIILSNSALIQMLGYYSFEELAKRNLEKEGFEPNYPRSRFKEIMEKEGEVKGLESAWMRRDKTVLLIRENAKSIRDENGNILYYEGTVEDVTERKKAELELEKSRQRYIDLFESAPDSIVILDLRGFITSCNTAAVKLSGYSKEELVGKHFSKLGVLRLSDIPKYLKLLNSIIEGNIPEPLEVIYIHKNGNLNTVEVQMALLKEDGRTTGVQVIVRDITERKKVEEALRASEQRYKLLFEKNLAGVYHTTLDGKMLNCNESFARLLGYDSAEEVMTHRAVEFYFKDAERKDFLALLQRKGNLNDFEICMRRRDGKPVWILENVSLIKDEESGQISIQGTSIDVTERKHAEEALRESEERFRIASQIASDVVYERDGKTGIATFYGDIDSHLGYEPGGYPRTMEGWRNHVHPEDLTWIDNQSIDQLEPGVPYSIEYRMRKKDGSYMTWLDRIMIISDEKTGKPLKFIGAATNITERKRAEEELHVSEEKHRLVLDNIPVFIAAIDQIGKFILWNRYAKKMLGYTPQEAIGKIIPLDIHETKADADEVIRVASERGVYDKEIRFRCKDKTLIPVHLVVVPNKDSTGKIVGFYGFAEDIIERKRRKR